MLPLVLLAADPAWACRAPQFHSYLIWSQLPEPLPSGFTVLDVEFENVDEGASYQMRTDVMRARIKGVVRGGFGGSYVRVPLSGSSCSFPFQNGRVGLIVGKFGLSRNGELEFRPWWVGPAERRAFAR